MTCSPEFGPLPVTLAEACALARRLISVLKREAEALGGDSGDMPASLIAAKGDFVAAHTRILEQINGGAALGAGELQGLNELQALIDDMETAPLDSLIEAHPDNAELYFKRAGILFGQGRNDEARRDYLSVLSMEPAHFGALTDFGNLQMEAGHHSAARTLFSRAVHAHPDRAVGHVNLADLLLTATDYEAAKCHYQIALELDPGLNAAHQGLSLALAGLGDEAGASAHREAGFRGHAVITWPQRGTDTCVPVLVLSSAFGGNIPIRYALDDRTFQATVILTEYFDPATPLPAHQLIINLIGDTELCRTGLDAAELVLRNSDRPVINHPKVIRPTGRLENAQRLGVLPGVRAPRMALLPRAVLMTGAAEGLLAEHGIGFPLLLRSPGFHTGKFFVRVESPGGLAGAVADLPGDDLLAMQMLDARNRQGESHKYRVMFVDGSLYPLHLAISKHWKVHYFSAGMDDQPEYRALEAAFLRDMPAVLGDKAMTALESIRRVLGLDYGGIDFALGPDGGILLFEANATMAVNRPDDDEKWGYRRAATERILDAVRNMVISRVSGAE